MSATAQDLEPGQKFRLVYKHGESARRVLIRKLDSKPDSVWLESEVVGSKRRNIERLLRETPVKVIR